MNKKNLIFLDIDGVLNNSDSWKRNGSSIGWNMIDGYNLRNFLKIINSVECDIVISSSWRNDSDLLKKLRQIGIHYIDITPVCDERQDEIFAWLNKQSEEYNWITIDDDIHDLSKIDKMGRLFKTSFDSGLTARIAERIIQFFKN